MKTTRTTVSYRCLALLLVGRDREMADLYRAANRDGVFFYTLFKGTATLD